MATGRGVRAAAGAPRGADRTPAAGHAGGRTSGPAPDSGRPVRHSGLRGRSPARGGPPVDRGRRNDRRGSERPEPRRCSSPRCETALRSRWRTRPSSFRCRMRSEEILARRVLGPADYLEAGSDVAHGIAAQGDVNLGSRSIPARCGQRAIACSCSTRRPRCGRLTFTGASGEARYNPAFRQPPSIPNHPKRRRPWLKSLSEAIRSVSQARFPSPASQAPDFSLATKDLEGRRARRVCGQAQGAEHRAQPGHAGVREEHPRVQRAGGQHGEHGGARDVRRPAFRHEPLLQHRRTQQRASRSRPSAAATSTANTASTSPTAHCGA